MTNKTVFLKSHPEKRYDVNESAVGKICRSSQECRKLYTFLQTQKRDFFRSGTEARRWAQFVQLFWQFCDSTSCLANTLYGDLLRGVVKP